MLRHIVLLLLLAVLAAGCGDTYRQQLSKDYQRLVLTGKDVSQSQIDQVCKDVIKAEFGKFRPGKISNSYVSFPVKFVDARSQKTGKTVCYMTYIPYESYTEVFVQVSRHVAQDGSFSNSIYKSGYKGNSHNIATPMESGENLPASRKVRWLNVGRDRVRENRILSIINDKLGIDTKGNL